MKEEKAYRCHLVAKAWVLARTNLETIQEIARYQFGSPRNLEVVYGVHVYTAYAWMSPVNWTGAMKVRKMGDFGGEDGMTMNGYWKIGYHDGI